MRTFICPLFPRRADLIDADNAACCNIEQSGSPTVPVGIHMGGFYENLPVMWRKPVDHFHSPEPV